jgi:mandelate racemase
VKKRIGGDIALMTDFNQSQTVTEAIQRGRALDDEGLYWIEEPVRHDNYAGCAKIALEVKTPIQIGENLLSTFEMQKAIEAKAAEYYMPDVQRIGGVTGWMRAAALAHAHHLEMSSHLFPEISAHLLAVTPTCHWLEYMDWVNPILQEPFEVRNGNVGIAWNEHSVQRLAAA